MLDQEELKKQLMAAFDRIKKNKDIPVPSSPLLSPFAANELAMAYDTWIKNTPPKAGGALSISSPGQTSLLAASLASIPLMAGWAPGLLAYWTPVLWKGPGFSAAPNPTIPAGILALAVPLATLISPPPKVTSEDAFAAELAGILYAGTKIGIIVTATPDATGTPAPVPIV